MIGLNFTFLNRRQCLSIHGCDSKFITAKLGALQGTFLGPLLFLTYINGLNQGIKFDHFANDTDLL